VRASEDLALAPLPADAPDALRAAFEADRARLEATGGDAESWTRLGALCEANLFWEQAAACFARAAQFPNADPLCALHAVIARTQLDEAHFDSAQLVERAAAYPRSAPWKQFVADVLLDRNEIDAARTLYAQASELAPDRPEPWTGLAECALERDSHAEAIDALHKAIGLDPKYRAAHYLLGRAYQAVGRGADAQREFALGAGGVRRRLPDRLAKAAEALTFDFERVLGLAAEWTRDGRAADAEALLRRHAERNAADPRLGVNLGLARLRQGDPHGALKWIDSALVLDPRAYMAHVNRSVCLLELGQHDEALAAAERAVECAPASHRTHLALARALAVAERHREASSVARRAVELEPRDPAARQALGEALLILGEDDDEALAQFEAQRDLLPASWLPHAELARALAIAGRKEQAQAAMAAARQLHPDEAVLARLATQFGL